MDLTLSDVNNNVIISPAVNGVYSSVCASQVSGILTNNDFGTPVAEVISIDIDQASITATNLQIAGGPPSFPMSFAFGVPYTFTFDLTPSGVIGNTDTIKFTINTLLGSYEYIYDFIELDPASIFGTTPNPITLGTVYVGTTIYGPVVEINNQSCIAYDFDYSTTLPDVTWLQPTPINVSYASLGAISYSFSPAFAYGNLSGYSVTIDNGCITPSIPFSGQAIDAPVVSGVSKISVSNSISFM